MDPPSPTARGFLQFARQRLRSESDAGDLLQQSLGRDWGWDLQGPEVRTGFEPAYNGFANRCLTAWLPHRSVILRRDKGFGGAGTEGCGLKGGESYSQKGGRQRQPTESGGGASAGAIF